MDELSLESILDGLETDEMTKQASEENAVAEPSVADELQNTLTKQASEEETMNLTGKSIADSILANLEKAASNNVDVETSAMVSDDDAKVKETPRAGKSVTETAKALLAQGGGVNEDGGVTAEREGNEDTVVSAVPSNLDKVASVADLIDEGVDFEDAVLLVKEASDALEAEAMELEKVAAVNELMAEGIDMEDAVALVKQACDQGFEEEYSDMEKAAAVATLVAEDGFDLEEAFELVKEASIKEKAKTLGSQVYKATGLNQIKAKKIGKRMHEQAKFNTTRARGDLKNKISRNKGKIGAGAGAAAIVGGSYAAGKASGRNQD